MTQDTKKTTIFVIITTLLTFGVTYWVDGEHLVLKILFATLFLGIMYIVDKMVDKYWPSKE